MPPLPDFEEPARIAIGRHDFGDLLDVQAVVA